MIINFQCLSCFVEAEIKIRGNDFPDIACCFICESKDNFLVEEKKYPKGEDENE